MSEYSKTAISWMGLRDALLYFPYVVSLFEIEHLGSGRLAATRFLRAHERTFLPPDIPQTAVTDLKGIIKAVRSLRRHIEEQAMKATPDSSALSAINEAFEGEPGKAIKRAMLSFYAHYKPSRNLPLITASNLGTKSTESEDIAINIALLKLIDTRALTLEQLLEFRKDQEAVNKLRRFRLFAYNNYAGKSRDYIEDDILTRLADYEQAVKKWGFGTASGTITTLLNSSLIAGGVAGSFLTAYFNAPLPAIASAMTATGLAIANMAVNLGQQRFAQKELMANNPVSYISYAKEKLEGK